jgi:hypothetical protein
MTHLGVALNNQWLHNESSKLPGLQGFGSGRGGMVSRRRIGNIA